MAKADGSETVRLRAPLSRERVLAAAVELADEDGIERLSMRRLAQKLGVEAMSLYNHVANKDEMLDGIVERVVAEIELPPDEDEWDVAIRKYAVDTHATLRRHPWAANLVLSPGTGFTSRPTTLRNAEWLLRRLREGGFSADVTYHAYHAIDAHILGFTMWALGHAAGAKSFGGGKGLAELAASFIAALGSDYPYLSEHAEQHTSPREDGISEFEFGLDLILEGLKRLRAAT